MSIEKPPLPEWVKFILPILRTDPRYREEIRHTIWRYSDPEYEGMSDIDQLIAELHNALNITASSFIQGLACPDTLDPKFLKN